MSSATAKIGQSDFIQDEAVREARKRNMLLFCALLFMGALLVADITSVKLFSYPIFGYTLIFPAGTLAFAFTFLAEDVIMETGGRREALKVVWITVSLRVLIVLYFIYSIGDQRGAVGLADVPGFWTLTMQEHYKFVFGGSVPIYLAGFVAVAVAFLNDAYLFNYMRQIQQGRNLFWLRNTFSTAMSQIINSVIFVSLAFGAELTIPQIVSAIAGQCFFKIILSLADNPLAYLMKNYGQGRIDWYKIWSPKFWKG